MRESPSGNSRREDEEEAKEERDDRITHNCIEKLVVNCSEELLRKYEFFLDKINIFS